MVAGGVGLAPFATLAEALAARGTPTTLFYGARPSADLFYLDFFERLGVTLVLRDRGRQPRRARARDRRRSTRALAVARARRRRMIYACGPEPMLAAVAGSRRATRSRARSRSSTSWAAAWAAATAASSE